MMDWLLSAGEGGTRRGCWEATEVGGKWGGRIFSAINCSLILLIKTRLSSWWMLGGEEDKEVGQGVGISTPQPLPCPSVLPPPQNPTVGGSYLAGHGGGGWPEVGVVETRLRHPAGRESEGLWGAPTTRQIPLPPPLRAGTPPNTTLLPKKKQPPGSASRQGEGGEPPIWKLLQDGGNTKHPRKGISKRAPEDAI